MKHGVGNGRRGWALGGLTCPQAGVCAAGHQVHVHRGHFAETQDGISLPVLRQDFFGIKAHRFFQSPTGGLNGPAFQLRHRAIGVHHLANVGDHRQAAHPHFVRHLHFGGHGAIRAFAFVAGKRQAQAPAFLALQFGAAP